MGPRLLVLVLLIFGFLTSAALSQNCGTTTFQVTGVVGDYITIPGGAVTCTYTVTYPALANGDGIPFIAQFQPNANVALTNLGKLTITGKLTPTGSTTTLAVLAGPPTAPTTKTMSSGSTYANDIGGDTTFGNVLRFFAVTFTVKYQSTSASNPTYYLLFKISNPVPGYDLDRDGYLYPTQDCCDTQVTCTRPTLVNMGAFNIAGNGINDAGYGSVAACTTFSDVAEVTSCSSSEQIPATAAQLVQAMDLCKTTTDNATPKQWGVISSSFTYADTTTSFSNNDCKKKQAAVYTTFSDYYKPGETFAFLSSGKTDDGDFHTRVYGTGDASSSCSSDSTSTVPGEYTSQHGNHLYTVTDTGCGDPNNTPDVYDSINLKVKIRVPTNANSLTFLIKFMSTEYPVWACTQYNDFFLGLLYRDTDPSGYTPADHNIATYNTGTQKIPLSINLQTFFVVCQSGTRNGKPIGENCQNLDPNTLTATNLRGHAGSMDMINSIPVYPGEVITLNLMVFDVGDSILDSQVILDKFAWSSNTVVGTGGLAPATQCPNSPVGKTAPGVCGCNVADTDTDGDGVLDCNDVCPNDPLKTTAAGNCGCGTKEGYFDGQDSNCVLGSNQTSCCFSSGYLGGTADYQISSSVVSYSFENFLSTNYWCKSNGAFYRCAEKGGFTTTAPQVGDAIPSLEFNSGTVCGVTCTGGFSQVVDPTSTTATTKTGSNWGSSTNPGSYISNNYQGTSMTVTMTFTIPAAGVYFLSLEALALTSTTTAILSYKVTQGATTLATFRYKPVNPAGTRLLGAVTVSSSASIVVTVTVDGSSANPSTIVVTKTKLTNYNPSCDISTVSASPNSEGVYVPAGATLVYEVVSSCQVTLEMFTEATTAATLTDATSGDGKIRVTAPTTGGITYVFKATLTGSSCTTTAKKYWVYPLTVTNIYAGNSYLEAEGTFPYYYQPGCPSSTTFAANFEGVARTFGGLSYRQLVTTAAALSVSSPQFALPSYLVLTQGSATQFKFGVNRLSGTNAGVRFGTVAEFSATSHSEDSLDLTSTSPSLVAFGGSLASQNLYLSVPASLSLGKYTLTLMAYNTDTKTAAPYDVVVSMVSSAASTRPSVAVTGSLVLNCPSTITVTVTSSSAVTLAWRPEFPLAYTTVDNMSSTQTRTFTMTPTSTDTFYVQFTANNGAADGFGYGLLTGTVAASACAACEHGTCNCAGTCVCFPRYTGPSCTAYTDSAPVISTPFIQFNEDTVAQGNLAASDADSDPFTFQLVASSVPASMTISVTSAGAYTITPAANYFNYNAGVMVTNQTFSVIVTQTTGAALSTTKIIQVKIDNVNDPPTLISATATVDENCAVFTVTSVSATDVDGDALTFTFGSAALGTLNRNAVSSTTTGLSVTTVAPFTYVCLAYQYGVDTISLTVSDGNVTVSSPVVITVNYKPYAPTVQNQYVTTTQEQPIDITLSATVPQGTYSISIPTLPTKGTLALQSGNTYRYLNTYLQNGADSFQFQALGNGTGGLASTATVFITITPINYPPVVGTNQFPVYEDNALPPTNLVVTDVDNTQAQLTYAIGTKTPSDITATLSASGALSVTPPLNYFGTVTIGFTVKDLNSTLVPGTATINVLPVNDAPTFTVTNVTVLENSGAYSAQVLQNLVLEPNDNTQAISSVSLTFLDNSKQALFSTLPAVSTAGILTFTFDTDLFGFADVKITVKDNGGVNSGGVDTSAPVTFRIQATFVNRPPKATPVTVTSNENDAINQMFATNLGKGPIAGVTNEDSQTLTFTVSSHNCGSLLTASPTLLSNGYMTATPKPYAFGSCQISYSLADNGGTANGGQDTTTGSFTLNILPVNQAPYFTSPVLLFTYNETQSSGGLATTASFASNISPGADNEQSDNVVFVLSASTSPLLVGSVTLGLDGILRFTLAQYQFGDFSFDVTLTETNSTAPRLSSAKVTVTLRVNPVNNAPDFTLGTTSLAYFESQTAQPKSVVFATAMTAGPSNEASQVMSFVLTHNCAPALFSSAPVISTNQATGTLTFTIDKYRFLSSACTLSIQLFDNGGVANGGANASTVKTISLMVNWVNQAPSFTAGVLTITKAEDFSNDINYNQLWATNLQQGTNDPAQTFTFIVTQSSSTNVNLFLTAPAISSAGILSFVVKNSQAGLASFTVVLKDNGLTSNGGVDTSPAVTLNVVVQPSNFNIDFTLPAQYTISERIVDNSVVTATNLVTAISSPAANYSATFVAEVQVVSGDSLFSSPPQVILHNDYDVSGAAGTANLVFTPVTFAFGQATISVILSIPSKSVSLQKNMDIIITGVNQPPTFDMPSPVVRAEDAGAVVIAGFATNILAGPMGEGILDSQTVNFTITGCTNPTIFAVAPAMSIQGSAGSQTGTLTFSTAADANGNSDCTVTLADSLGAQTSTTLTIQITPVNDPPSFSLTPSTTSVEDVGSVTLADFATAISKGPANEAYQTVSFTLTASPSNLFSAQPALTSTGTLTYTSDSTLFGSATVTAVLTDSEGATATSTFTITVLPKNNAPTFQLARSSLSDLENSGAVTVSSFASNLSPGPANEASQTLSWSFSVSNPTLFVADGNGIIFTIDSNGNLKYTLQPYTSGSATISITLSDNGGTANGGVNATTLQVTYNLTFVNYPPSFNPGPAISVLESFTPLTTTLTNWATSISKGGPNEGFQTLTFTLSTNNSLITSVTLNESTGTLTITPVVLEFGTTTLNATLCDNHVPPACVWHTVPVVVVHVNVPPTFSVLQSTVSVVEDDGITSVAGVLGAISVGPYNELNLDTPSFVVTVTSATVRSVAAQASAILSTPFATISPTGTLTLTRLADGYGEVVLSVRMFDGTDYSAATSVVTVIVRAKNDAPSYTLPSATLSVNEDSVNSVLNPFSSLSKGPSNENYQALSFTISSVSQPAAFTVQPALSPAGTLTFSLVQYFHGQVTFQVVLSDDGGVTDGGSNSTAPFTLTLNVNHVNHLPVAGNDTASTNEDTAIDILVLSNDADVDVGDTLKVSAIILQPLYGTVVINPAGASVRYTPTAPGAHTDKFSYVATDGYCQNCLSNVATVTVSIADVNHAPVAQGNFITVTGDLFYEATNSSLLPSTDSDGDSVTYSVVAAPTHGAVTFPAGKARYTPTLYYCGPDAFTYKVNDGQLNSNVATVSITVTCVPHTPNVNDIYLTMGENNNTVSASKPFQVAATTVDAGATLSFACTRGPNRGAVQITPNTLYPIANTVYYTPTPWLNGNDTIPCYVQSSNGLTTAFMVYITVLGPANHPPAVLTPFLLINGFEDISGSGQVSAVDYDNQAITYLINSGPSPASICSVAFSPTVGGRFTYTPLPNRNGWCNFTWVVNDGLANSVTVGSVAINLAPVNDVPVALDGAATGYESTPIVSYVNASDADTLYDNDHISYELISIPANGVVTWTDAGNSPQFTYLGNPQFNGIDSFTYAAYDLAFAQSTVKTVTITVIAVNDPPVATPFSYQLLEDGQVAISLASLVSDPDNTLSQLSFSVSSAPAHGSVTKSTGGVGGGLTTSIMYIPTLYYHGMDSFVYTVSDGMYQSSAAITLNMTHVNHAPVAQPNTWTLPSNTFFADKLVGTDVDNDALTYTIVTPPTNGSLDSSALPNVVYTATVSSDPNYQNTDSFQFRVSDGVLTSTATISIAIIKTTKQRPVAVAKSYSVNEDSSVTSFLNGTDPQGDSITYSITKSPSHGQLVLLSEVTGAFTYTPTPLFHGVDSFDFRVKNSFFYSSSVTNQVTVNHVNHPPTAKPFSASTLQNVPVTVTLQGVDVDGDALTYSLAQNGANGNAVITGNQLTYTPLPNRYGSDSLSYTTNDGAITSTAGVISLTIVHVNQPPIALNTTFTFNGDTTLNGVFSATDIDSSNLVFTADANRNVVGAFTYNPNGNFVYTPPLYYHGTQLLPFTVSDGQLTSTSYVTLITLAVPHAPTATPATVSLLENSHVDITLTGADVDGDSLTFQIQRGVTISGATLTVVSPGVVRYTPPYLANGADSFTFLAFDGLMHSLSAAQITINIIPVDQAPVAYDDVYNVIVGHSVSVTVRATDEDTDTNLLSLSLPNKASLVLGTAVPVISPPRTFVYTATAGSNGGVEVVQVTLSDGLLNSTASITFYVTKLQTSPPRVTNIELFGTQGVSISNRLDLAVVAKSANLASFLIASFPTASQGQLLQSNGNPITGGKLLSPTGAFLFQPAASFYGSATFTIKAVDVNGGVSNVGQVTLTLSHVNAAPVAYDQTFVFNEGEAFTATLQGTDVDSSVLSFYFQSTQNLQGAYSLDSVTGAFTITTPDRFSGSLSFAYLVEDDQGASSNVATITLTVLPVNHAPTLSAFSFSTPESVPLNGAVSGADVDGNALTYTLISSPSQGVLTFNSDGTFVYSPTTLFYGSDSFNVEVSDGHLAAQNTVSLTVTFVNHDPTATPLSVSVNQDEEVCGSVFGNDIDGGDLQYYQIESSGPNNGLSFFISTTGQFCYTGSAGFVGQDAFSFFVIDPQGASSIAAIVTITVLAVSHPPKASNVIITMNEGDSEPGELHGTDADAGTVLSFSISRNPSFGTLVLGDLADNVQAFTYTPNEHYFGVDIAYYTVSDGTTEATGTIFITVEHVNHDPVAFPLSIYAEYQTSSESKFIVTDVDSADVLSYEVVDKPQHGRVVITGSSFVYFYDENVQATEDTFTYRANDGTADSNIALVNCTLYRGPTPTKDNISGNNGSTGNITVAAALGSLGALAAVGLGYFAYRKFAGYQETKAHMNNLKVADTFQNNPLYETLSHEQFNPLYEAQGEVAVHYSPLDE